MKKEHVISAPDVKSVYDVPLNFEKDDISKRICEVLGIKVKKPADLTKWKDFVKRSKNGKDTVKIAVVGKYFNTGDFVLSDVYLSVIEALKYSAYALHLTPEITYLSSHDFADKAKLKKLDAYDGVLVPGGFGSTGIQGKLNVIEYVRKKRIPYFGICYGMQLAVLEFAKNVLRLKDASTEEIDPNAKDLVIGVMPDQKEKIAKGEMGGTMRLGEYETVLKPKSIVHDAYKKYTERSNQLGTKNLERISERHRHRYEVNPEYITKLEAKGMVFSGKSPDGTLMETMELSPHVHPFFVGVQYHPEFHARPLAPHPLFTAFVKASYENKG